MHKIDKHTGLYLEWNGGFADGFMQHFKADLGLCVDDIIKPGEVAEEYRASDGGGTQAALDLFDNIHSKAVYDIYLK